MLNRAYLIIFFLCLFLFVGCKKRYVANSHDAQVKVFSNHEVYYKTYRFLQGRIHGYFWEFKKDHAFKIWFSNNKDEIDVYIPVSDEFLKYDDKAITKNWEFEEKTDKGLITYLVGDKEKGILLEVKLPERITKVKGYSFTILSNHVGEYLVMFAGGSDYIADANDNPIFGYIVVKERKKLSE